uniref:Uncharacterized protein n=1 Tax=Anguilla anguilla TaxID=7936 RepID=A0A0E9PFT9_ANGAN
MCACALKPAKCCFISRGSLSKVLSGAEHFPASNKADKSRTHSTWRTDEYHFTFTIKYARNRGSGLQSA